MNEWIEQIGYDKLIELLTYLLDGLVWIGYVPQGKMSERPEGIMIELA